MKKLLERYFPIMQSRSERVGNWVRRKKLNRSKRYSTASFDVINCVVRAPIPAAAGSKVLFVSDWHWHNSEKNFSQLADLEKTAALLAPDVLVLGGDIVEDADVVATLPELLSRLRKLAPECIAVMGNWEVGKRWIPEKFWHKLYADAGIKLLCNSSVICGAMRFHGINDISSGDCNLPEKLDPEFPKAGSLPLTEIIVTHSPDTVIALDDNLDLYHYDAALCGHCHGGQIRLPFIGALFCPSRYGRSFDRGCFVRSNSQLKMIVSSGMGEKRHSFRLFCRPEAVLLTFREARHYRHRMVKKTQV